MRDDRAELLVLHGVEFAGAAGDEDTAGTGVHTLGDVAGERVEVDASGLGTVLYKRGDGEEQDAVKGGAHNGAPVMGVVVGVRGQAWVSWPSMRRHRCSGLPSAIALGSKAFGTSW